MLELTKKRHTNDSVCFQICIPSNKANKFETLLKNIISLLKEIDDTTDNKEFYSIEETFPDLTPGDALRGARELAGLTQQKLANLIGVSKTHISEMERGKRTIGKQMAKRLAEALHTSYKVFL